MILHSQMTINADPASGDNNAPATITPINVDDTPEVNASAPAHSPRQAEFPAQFYRQHGKQQHRNHTRADQD